MKVTEKYKFKTLFLSIILASLKLEHCHRALNKLKNSVTSVSLSLSHCYPGSGVVLDCIDS